jgi:hypothetical protein
MPELTVLSSLWTMLRSRQALATRPENRDAGVDVVQYVIITAALAVGALAIVGIIINKITSKATNLKTE